MSFFVFCFLYVVGLNMDQIILKDIHSTKCVYDTIRYHIVLSARRRKKTMSRCVYRATVDRDKYQPKSEFIRNEYNR